MGAGDGAVIDGAVMGGGDGDGAPGLQIMSERFRGTFRDTVR